MNKMPAKGIPEAKTYRIEAPGLSGRQGDSDREPHAYTHTSDLSANGMTHASDLPINGHKEA